MLAVSSRIPIPPHLGGGWVDDPGPAPLDRRARQSRLAWRNPAVRAWVQAKRAPWLPPLPGNAERLPELETWRPDEIEECARFARMRRDD